MFDLPQSARWTQDDPIKIMWLERCLAPGFGAGEFAGCFLSDARRKQVNDTAYVALLAGRKMKNPRAIYDCIEILKGRRPIGGAGAGHVDGKVASRLRMLSARD